jgi:hypothetical protein
LALDGRVVPLTLDLPIVHWRRRLGDTAGRSVPRPGHLAHAQPVVEVRPPFLSSMRPTLIIGGCCGSRCVVPASGR